MASGMEWFRWHHGTVTDPKFRLIARRTGASMAEVIAVWAVILEEASMCEERGSVGRIDFEALDCALGLADGLTLTIYNAMAERDLIDVKAGVVSKWHKRQPKREREDESSSVRVRAYRERKANKADETPDSAESTTCNHETPCNAMKRHETPRGEESRGEVNQNLSLASSNVDQPPPTPAGVVCARLRKAGVMQVNPSNPKLLALLAQGVTADELADLAGEPGSKGKGFNWLLAAAAGRRQDAAQVVALPPARASPRTETHTDRMSRVTAELTGAHRTTRETPHEHDITADSQRLEG